MAQHIFFGVDFDLARDCGAITGFVFWDGGFGMWWRDNFRRQQAFWRKTGR